MGDEVRGGKTQYPKTYHSCGELCEQQPPLLLLCFFLQPGRFPERSALICPEEDPPFPYENFLRTVDDTCQAEIAPLCTDCMHPATRHNTDTVHGAHVNACFAIRYST